MTLGASLALAAASIPAVLLALLLVSPVLTPPLRASLVALCIVSVARPDVALLITAAFVGFGMILAHLAGVPLVRVSEVLVLVSLLASFVRAAVSAPFRHAIRREVSLPIVALAITASVSTLVWQRVYQFQQGDWPAYAEQLHEFFTRYYFVQPGDLWFVVSTAVMLEGLALYVIVAAHCRTDATFFDRGIRILSLGGAGLAVMSVVRLGEIALRSPGAIAAMRATSAGLRISPQISDTIAAGAYFAVCWLATLGLAIAARGWRRSAWLLAGAPPLMALYLTGSRSPILTAFGGVALLATVLVVRERGVRARSVVAFAAVAMVAIVVSYPVLIGRDVAGAKAAKSMTIRAELFKAGLRVIETRPLLGIGIDRFYLVASGVASPELNAMWRGRKNPHNDFLRIGAELGLVGLGLFVWVLVVAGRRTWRGIDRTVDPRLIALASGLVAFLVTMLVGNPLMLREVSYEFWIAVGLAVGRGAATENTEHVSGRNPSATGWLRRRQPWLIAAFCLALALSIPYRARQEIAQLDLNRITYGLFEAGQDRDGTRYRWSGREATFFIGGRVRQVAIPLRGTMPSGEPQQVEIRLDRRLANRVQVGAEWKRVRIDLPKGRAGVPRRIDLLVSPTWLPSQANAEDDDEQERGVMVGTLDTLTQPASPTGR